MMKCRFCNWFCDRFGGDCARLVAALWGRSDRWEVDRSNEWELWEANSIPHEDRISQALALSTTDPVAAFALYRELADAGSVYCMERTAWRYYTGTGVPVDLTKALEYYCRAFDAGSKMAMIDYARLLEEDGRHADWPAVLENGIQQCFVPASFWRAWLQYKQSRSGTAAREVKPLLEYAAAEGHPGAQFTLALFTGQGKFGLWQVPKGIVMLRESLKLPPEEMTVGDVGANP